MTAAPSTFDDPATGAQSVISSGGLFDRPQFVTLESDGTLVVVDATAAAVVRVDADEPPGPEATWRCPTGAIVWLEGRQFDEPEEEDVPVLRNYG